MKKETRKIIVGDTCEQETIAITIFAYNRAKHLHSLFETLVKLEIGANYCIHIFHDGPNNGSALEVQKTREVTRNFQGKFSRIKVTFREKNMGLANSIRNGLNEVFTNHKMNIILEDDIIPSGAFFQMMEYFLLKERDNLNIGSITGANTTKFPIGCRAKFLLSRRHSSWGWSTWSDRWNSINWNLYEESSGSYLEKKIHRVSPDLIRYAQLSKQKKIDSWATFMNIDFISRDLFCIVPSKNYIQNIGFDGTGTHTGNNLKNQSMLSEVEQFFSPPRTQNISKSKIYDFLVFKSNSLLRDFPKGTIIRAYLKVRRILQLAAK